MDKIFHKALLAGMLFLLGKYDVTHYHIDIEVQHDFRSVHGKMIKL